MTIKLTAAALFLVTALSGGPIAEMSIAESVSRETETVQVVFIDEPLTLEEYVRAYFADTPILAEIAWCESRFRHLGNDGRIIRGALSGTDVGVMQINEFYHGERAVRLGFDLHTLEGNLAYAKWLYEKEGVLPWRPSERCWQTYEHLARETEKGVTHSD
ncbi:MAG: hypothetical protein Greene041679_81 [Parcubacteria group bacterium Greene0416_79]|nr:MAG: hypothetical protein Greene041679_81 [Parcubacteria group bacterium Greene0416_79]